MKQFKIEGNDVDIRLDKFLKKLFPNATRSLIYKLNRKEKIKIKTDNSQGKFKKKDNEYKLQLGDEVKIFVTDEDFQKLSQITEKKSSFSGEKLSKKDIVFEDSDLLIINKNPGLNVHPGDHKTSEVSLIQQVHDYLGNKYDSLTFKPSLVHRIDRDTSGIVLIAKKKDILTNLVNDFKKHNKIKKIYTAFVLGKLPHKKGSISKKLKRIENAQNENKVQVSEDGQNAKSNYKVIEEYIIDTNNKGKVLVSQVEVEIETGRMHQIRVHMASIGNPIIGDKTYGDKKFNSFFKNNYGINRQMLHASKIEFFHYGRGKTIVLEARLKEDMLDFINKVKTKG